MSLHYRFCHACGHTGIGPIIFRNISSTYHYPQTLQSHGNELLTTIQLILPCYCPFCPTSSFAITPEMLPGQGVLTILSSTFPWTWSIIRVCEYETITPQDWAHSTDENGSFRQMAWLPKPCGEVRVVAGLEEEMSDGSVQTGVVMQVHCAWNQNADEGAGSRFAGMLSQLKAAVLSKEQAGR